MSSLLKEPSIKLIPSDPTTNTILIIYCVSCTGASVPYKSTWRKISSKRARTEEIKNHNGSSYRCSPLDVDCIIEATVYFQHLGTQLARVVQSNMVKVSRELKERRAYMREPILCRMSLDELPFEVKLYVQERNIHVVPTAPTLNHINYTIQIADVAVDVDGNQLTFKLLFRQRFEEFLGFIEQMLGWKPQTKNHWITLLFGSDINRDIIILGIAEVVQKIEGPTVEKPTLNFPISNRTIIQKIDKVERGGKIDRQEQGEKGIEGQDGAHSRNKNQPSVSPTSGYKQKFKMVGKLVEMKRSYTNHNSNQTVSNQKSIESHINTQYRPQIKTENKDTVKEREYLNVFQDEDLQLLGPPLPPKNTPEVPVKPKTAMAPQILNPGDQPSINLRGSFQQLQKSFNANLNDQALDRVFGDKNTATKKMQQQIDRLHKQNQQLKKQAENISALTKQNNTLKRKYHEMKEEINRLQMERKVILTDKLRCEVNWHKEIQEKEQMKKQLEYLRETLKNTGHNHMERSIKTNSFHDAGVDRWVDNRDVNREMNRSPNNSFYR